MDLLKKHKFNATILAGLAIIYLVGLIVVDSRTFQDIWSLIFIPLMITSLKLRKTADGKVLFDRELGKSKYLPLLYLVGLGAATLVLLIAATRFESSL